MSDAVLRTLKFRYFKHITKRHKAQINSFFRGVQTCPNRLQAYFSRYKKHAAWVPGRNNKCRKSISWHRLSRRRSEAGNISPLRNPPFFGIPHLSANAAPPPKIMCPGAALFLQNDQLGVHDADQVAERERQVPGHFLQSVNGSRVFVECCLS